MNKKFNNFLVKISRGSVKYKDPRQVKLKNIDPKIRKVIKNINYSNWCWTIWSCQGHFNKDNSISAPYITFIVLKDKVDLLINLIYNTLPIYKSKKFPVASNYNVQIHRQFNNKHFSIVSVYWSVSFLNSKKDNFDFYSDLEYLSNNIRKHK